MTSDEIVTKLLETADKLRQQPAAPRFDLALLVPLRRTAPGNWRMCGRRFRTWRLGFTWAAARGLVALRGPRPAPPQVTRPDGDTPLQRTAVDIIHRSDAQVVVHRLDRPTPAS